MAVVAFYHFHVTKYTKRKEKYNMITIEKIPTPKELFKNLYSRVRCHCSAHDIMQGLSNKPIDPYIWQEGISELIQDYTHICIPSCYAPTFSKQLRRYFYTYRHYRLGGVSPH